MKNVRTRDIIIAGRTFTMSKVVLDEFEETCWEHGDDPEEVLKELIEQKTLEYMILSGNDDWCFYHVVGSDTNLYEDVS